MLVHLLYLCAYMLHVHHHSLKVYSTLFFYNNIYYVVFACIMLHVRCTSSHAFAYIHVERY